MKTITGQQFRRLLEQPDPTCPTGARNRVILRLMYEAGLRGEEITTLRRGDVDLVAGTVTAGEGKVRRTVPLLSACLEDLRRWLKQHPGGLWLTPTLRGTQISSDYIRSMVTREAKAAGLGAAEVTPKVLRDSCGCELAREFTVHEIQELLGLADRRSAAKFVRAGAPGIAERMRARETQPALPEKPDAAEVLREVLADPASRRGVIKSLVSELREELAEELRAAGAGTAPATAGGS